MFTLPTKAIGWLRCSKPASHEQHSINLRTYYATGTFCGYFCGVNILTMTKRYDKTDTRKKPLIFSLYLYLHVYIGRFHTKGRTNRLDGQIAWLLSVWCQFMSYCRRVVRLVRQIIWKKTFFQTTKYQTKNVFFPFAHPFVRLRWLVRSDDFVVL